MLDVQTKLAITAAIGTIFNALCEALGWITDNTATMAGIGGLIVLGLTMRNTILQGRIANLKIEEMEHQKNQRELKDRADQVVSDDRGERQ